MYLQLSEQKGCYQFCNSNVETASKIQHLQMRERKSNIAGMCAAHLDYLFRLSFRTLPKKLWKSNSAFRAFASAILNQLHLLNHFYGCTQRAYLQRLYRYTALVSGHAHMFLSLKLCPFLFRVLSINVVIFIQFSSKREGITFKDCLFSKIGLKNTD